MFPSSTCRAKISISRKADFYYTSLLPLINETLWYRLTAMDSQINCFEDVIEQGFEIF
jgi:hypothetical protein